MTAKEAIKAQVYITERIMGGIQALDPNVRWPVIEFVKAKYSSGPHPTKTLITQMIVDVTNAQGTMEAAREQVPLILAW
jgi:hypothetical protein